MPALFRQIRYWLRGNKEAAELAEEMAFHREMKIRELQAEGLSEDAAAVAAAREMGNATLMREESRLVWIPIALESVWQDLLYALRMLRRQPVFTATALGALVLSIGLNTSLFTETGGRSSRGQFVTGDFFRVLGAGSLWPTRERITPARVKGIGGRSVFDPKGVA